MVNRGTRLVVAAAAVAVALPAHAAVHLGWVRVQTMARKATLPARYEPGHLVDGDRHTVTCYPGGPAGAVGAGITVGLRGTGRVTAVRIDNGDERSRRDAEAHNRVHVLVVEDHTATRTVTLPDAAGPQEVKLSPPVTGDKVEVYIRTVYGKAPLTCLSGVTFLAGRRPLVARRRRYDRRRAALEGLWAAGPKGAPERFLALYLDGRYRWTYAPNDPDAKGTRLEGRWRVRGHRLLLETRGHFIALRFRLRDHAATRQLLAPDSPAAADPANPREATLHEHRLELKGGRRTPKHLAGHYRARFD